ncbi:MAG: NUDIX hydrolase [Anaerolineales bacterium]|nr:NUDIX hydrolase [Anaerolineales bacterium]
MDDIFPYLSVVDGRRSFACFPVAILVFIVNQDEKVLLLSHPSRQGLWEVVNGALEANETILEAALRETREEVGEGVQVRPLGVIQAYSFHYDEQVQYMLSLGFLAAYEGGLVQPGDDMAGSRFRWCSLEELQAEDARLLVPHDGRWLVERAVQAYRLWKDHQVPLQSPLELSLKPQLKRADQGG